MPNTFKSLNTLDNELRKFQADFFGDTAVNVLDAASRIGDPTLLIGLGLIPGMEQRTKNAFNPELDQSVTQDIMIQGGDYVFPPTAQTLDIVSDSANDDVGGIGAETVLIRGLDGSHNEIEETINLDGLTPVTTTALFLRVNDFFVTVAGSSEFNEGIITAVQSTSLLEVTRIGADPKDGSVNVSYQFILTVPAGKTMAITSLIMSTSRMTGAGGIKEAGLFFITKEDGGVFTPSNFFSTRSDGASIPIIIPTYPLILKEKTDIRARGISFANNSALTVSLQYTLIDNIIFGLS